jgi:hypothetical protein
MLAPVMSPIRQTRLTSLGRILRTFILQVRSPESQPLLREKEFEEADGQSDCSDLHTPAQQSKRSDLHTPAQQSKLRAFRFLVSAALVLL